MFPGPLGEKYDVLTGLVMLLVKVKFEAKMLRGQVAQSIAKAAADADCELIVLGSKGRSAIKDLLIGSVAQRVASLSDVPVTLVK